jgi:hypothetical protein
MKDKINAKLDEMREKESQAYGGTYYKMLDAALRRALDGLDYYEQYWGDYFKATQCKRDIAKILGGGKE